MISFVLFTLNVVVMGFAGCCACAAGAGLEENENQQVDALKWKKKKAADPASASKWENEKDRRGEKV